MKEISLQELKLNLSRWFAAVARGEALLVTRHKRPIARITPAESDLVRTGKRFGRARLERLPGPRVPGALEVLWDDRRGGREPR